MGLGGGVTAHRSNSKAASSSWWTSLRWAAIDGATRTNSERRYPSPSGSPSIVHGSLHFLQNIIMVAMTTPYHEGVLLRWYHGRMDLDIDLPPVMAAGTWTSNADLIADCARLGYLQKDFRTIDPTWGGGKFWTTWQPDVLIGSDINPERSLRPTIDRLNEITRDGAGGCLGAWVGPFGEQRADRLGDGVAPSVMCSAIRHVLRRETAHQRDDLRVNVAFDGSHHAL